MQGRTWGGVLVLLQKGGNSLVIWAFALFFFSFNIFFCIFRCFQHFWGRFWSLLDCVSRGGFIEFVWDTLFVFFFGFFLLFQMDCTSRVLCLLCD